jgi:cell division protein FtsZ
MAIASGCVVEFEPESSGQHAPRRPDMAASILIIGVGGAGGNAVNNVVRQDLPGVRHAAINTDAQSLRASLAEMPLQIGRGLTAGLGAGGRPAVGRGAAEESLDAIHGMLEGADMVFLLAGMGGGTGTGAAPVVARAARDAGILTIGVVTKPFHFEGKRRMWLAEAGIAELERVVDTLIVIPNQNLFRVADEQMTLADAFRTADEVLCDGVRAISDLMTSPGLVNLDFADVRTVMGEAGRATIGTGEAAGPQRAVEAAEAAIVNPLIEDVALNAARGVLINVMGGPDMTLFEIDAAAHRIREEVGEAASIIFGSTFDERLEGRVRISVVATGVGAPEADAGRPAEPTIPDELGRPEEPSARSILAAAPVPAAGPGMSADAERADLRTRVSAEAAEPSAAGLATVAGTMASAIADQAIRACRTLNAAAERMPRPVLGGARSWRRRDGSLLRVPAAPDERRPA